MKAIIGETVHLVISACLTFQYMCFVSFRLKGKLKPGFALQELPYRIESDIQGVKSCLQVIYISSFCTHEDKGQKTMIDVEII